jgi:hypothetical protein
MSGNRQLLGIALLTVLAAACSSTPETDGGTTTTGASTTTTGGAATTTTGGTTTSSSSSGTTSSGTTSSSSSGGSTTSASTSGTTSSSSTSGTTSGGTTGAAGPVLPIIPGYNIQVFAHGGTLPVDGGSVTFRAPDAVEWDAKGNSGAGSVWIAYQDFSSKTGVFDGGGVTVDGGPSTIVEYDLSGNVLDFYQVFGHVDGMRIDPNDANRTVWSTADEDGNPTLVAYNPVSKQFTAYDIPTPHGGGYDDMAFINGNFYVAASAPSNLDSNGLNTQFGVYQILLDGGTDSNGLTIVNLRGILPGNFPNPDPITSTTSITPPSFPPGPPLAPAPLTTINLLDPDSMTTDLAGDLVLIDQGDNQIIVVSNPGQSNQVNWPYVVPTQLDDTVWIKSATGTLLIADGKGDTTYAITPTSGNWNVGDIWTESPNDSNLVNFLGILDGADAGTTTLPAYTNFLGPNKGLPIVAAHPTSIGMGKPTGLQFIPVQLNGGASFTPTPEALLPALPPYSVSLFASGGAALTNPDPVEFDGTYVWVAYQNNSKKDGSSDAGTSVVKYDLSGTQLDSFLVGGHSDGVRVDPNPPNLVWVTSNEDANPVLYSYDPVGKTTTTYSFPSPTPHGGGFDDLAFVGGQLFVAASNPSNLDVNGLNTAAAVYSITLDGGTDSNSHTIAVLTPVLAGNFANPDSFTNGTLPTVNLLDPDSMTVDPYGNLMLVDQADNLLVLIQNPGAFNQSAMPFLAPTQLDDTVWVSATSGYLLVADAKSDNIYKVESQVAWNKGALWTETPNDSTFTNMLGTIDTAIPSGGTQIQPSYAYLIAQGGANSLAVHPQVLGLNKPTGLIFIKH